MSVVYIYGQRGRASKAHIARHYPSGYGIHVLCGKSWREGDFAFSFTDASEVCARCASLQAKAEADGGGA